MQRNFAGYAPQHLPDMVGNEARAILPTGNFPGTMRPQYDTRVAPYQAQPETAQTWDLAHADAAEVIARMVHKAVEDADGWWFRFAPLELVQSGMQIWESISTDLVAWDPAAESTAPRLVQIRREKHAARMMRFNLGLQVLHDNYLTERGQEEFNLKMSMIVSGLVVTQKLCVASALIDAKLYWREQERILETHYTLADALKAQRSRFGALSKDPLAINKLWAEMPQMLKGNTVKPNFNMCIVPEGAIAHQKYGAQARYHTNASLRGEAAVQKNLVFDMAEFDGILPFPVFEDKAFQITNIGAEEIESFRRRAILGQFAILQHDDFGPTGFHASPEPCIEIVTMPADNWTPITMRQCLENCPRFGPDGTITAFTQALVEQWPAMRVDWPDTGDDLIDPWIVPYRPPGDNGRTVMAVAEFIGEQDVRFRDEMFDVDFGTFAKQRLGLNEDEENQLRLLLLAADVLHTPPAGFDGRHVAALMGVMGNPDEWGGVVLTDDIAGLGVPDERAYGWGDIFMVMSLLRQPTNAGDIPFTADGLDYTKAKAVLLKIWEGIKRMFPSLVTNDPSKVPQHRKVGQLSGEAESDRNAMIATFRGLLERVKHPMWTANAAVGGGFRGGPSRDGFRFYVFSVAPPKGSDSIFGARGATGFDTAIDDDAVRARVVGKVNDVMRTTYVEKLKPEGDDAYATLDALLNDQFDKYLAEFTTKTAGGASRVELTGTVKAYMAVVDGVFQMLRIAARARRDWRAQRKLTRTVLDAMAEHGRKNATDAYTQEAATHLMAGEGRFGVWSPKRLTFAPSAFGTDGSSIDAANQLRSPADPFNPDRALRDIGTVTGGTAQQKRDQIVHARARYGEEPVPPVPEHIEYSRVHRQPDPDNENRNPGRPYGDAKVQYVSASMAGEIGGPFLRLLPLPADQPDAAAAAGNRQRPARYAVEEREHMSRRQAIIKHHLGHDPVARLMAFCFILSGPTKEAMVALLDHGLPVPMNFMLAAPFINIDTEAIVFAEGGKQTASTGMNLLDINKSFDAAHKIWNVHASVHTGAKIVQPEKILLLEDAKMAGYIKGLEPDFFHIPEDLRGGDLMRMEKAMFCMDLPPNFTRSVALHDCNPVSLFGGRPDERFYAYNFKKPNEVFRNVRPSFPSYYAYHLYFGFGRINEGRTMNDATYRDLRESDWIPGTLWPTRIRTFNKTQGVFMQVQRGDGPLDDIELPMRDVLDGKIRYNDLHKLSHGMQ